MQPLSPLQQNSSTQLILRLNRVLGEINVVLIVIAIGLAVLDFTCFVTLTASTEIMRAQARLPAPIFVRTTMSAPGSAGITPSR